MTALRWQMIREVILSALERDPDWRVTPPQVAGVGERAATDPRPSRDAG